MCTVTQVRDDTSGLGVIPQVQVVTSDVCLPTHVEDADVDRLADVPTVNEEGIEVLDLSGNNSDNNVVYSRIFIDFNSILKNLNAGYLEGVYLKSSSGTSDMSVTLRSILVT